MKARKAARRTIIKRILMGIVLFLAIFSLTFVITIIIQWSEAGEISWSAKTFQWAAILGSVSFIVFILGLFRSELVSRLKKTFKVDKKRSQLFEAPGKRADKLTPTEVLGETRGKKNYGFYEHNYFDQRPSEEKFRKRMEHLLESLGRDDSRPQDRNLLLRGPPLMGKSRMVYEWLKNRKDIWVLILKKEAIDFSILEKGKNIIPMTIIGRKKVLLYIDDLHTFIKEPGFLSLFNQFNDAKDIGIVATSRGEYEISRKDYPLFETLSNQFHQIAVENPDKEQFEEWYRQQKEFEKPLEETEYDGTPGSAFVPLEEMRKRFRELIANDKTKQLSFLKACRIAYTFGIYRAGFNLRKDDIKTIFYNILNQPPNIDLQLLLVQLRESKFIVKYDVKKEHLKIPEIYYERVIFKEITKEAIIKEHFKALKQQFEENLTILYSIASSIIVHAYKDDNDLFVSDTIDIFEKILREKTNLKAWLVKGLAHDKLEEYRKALECYDRALALDETDTFAWVRKGLAHSDLQEYRKALECYDRALALDETDTFAWVRKGLAHSDLQEYRKTLECFDRALALDETDTNAWVGKGLAHSDLQEYRKALECYDRALALDEENSGAWYNKACLYALQNDKKKAITSLKKAIALDPSLKEEAKKDNDFDNIRNSKEFKELVEK
jgi:tetratricopeptide (TPR) repeat protein